MKIVFIGAGNLATRLSIEMFRAGMSIVQVYSRTMENARLLAKQINSTCTDTLDEIRTDADLYIFSLKDDVLQEVISRMPSNNGLWVHTAGSMPMSVFEGYTERYGVIYPFQTFSKERAVDFSNIPFFLEASSKADEVLLKKIAVSLTGEIHILSSEKRKSLHLAGVFGCNFVNHMYRLAAEVLEEQDISMKVLLPLIDETAAKVHSLPPDKAQTGPAVRYDVNVINKHLAMLSDPEMKEIYTLISKSIYNQTANE